MLLRKSRSRSRSGAAAAEMALVMNFIMVPLMIGLWEMGRVVQVTQIVANSAREGARMAAQGSTINQLGAPTQIKASSPPASALPNVKGAVMQYLSGAGLTQLNYADVDVTFTYLDSPPGALAGATEPFEGVKGQLFSVTVLIQDTGSNGDPLRTKCLWTALGLVRPTSVGFTAQWRILVDDSFTINAVLPTNNP
jgi:Flp pilus assembly protein TadG